MTRSAFTIIILSLLLASCSFIDRVFGPPQARITPMQVQTSQLNEENANRQNNINALKGAIAAVDTKIETEQTRIEAMRNQPPAYQPAVPSDRLWVTVSFASGRTGLTRESTAALKNLAAKFLTHKTAGQRLVVRGYTDDEPVGGYPGHRHTPRHHYPTNMALSQARADAVADVLMAANIASSDIQTEAFGASNFIADNKTHTDRQKNRRVEIHLLQ